MRGRFCEQVKEGCEVVLCLLRECGGGGVLGVGVEDPSNVAGDRRKIE